MSTKKPRSVEAKFETMNNSNEYAQWLTNIKERIKHVQIKAAISVNRELLNFYWELGKELVEKQANSKWGDNLLKQLSLDLNREFPNMKGFSLSNLKYAKQWYLFYKEESSISQQVVGQITQIPWGHNIAIISKIKNIDEAVFYVQNTIINNWSRSVLVHQIENDLFSREGKTLNNFSLTLPKPQSDLANQTLKDPYVFDFLNMTTEFNERDLENKLVEHLTSFLLELGAGFAFIGRQYQLQVGGKDFYIDLLFYHTALHCYVVVELKTVDFEPEFAGKLNFYIKAVDSKLRREGDQPTIGLLLCKSKNKLVAEYSLSDINKPIGVSEYQLTQSLPKDLKSSLPTIEEIEKEFSQED